MNPEKCLRKHCLQSLKSGLIWNNTVMHWLNSELQSVHLIIHSVLYVFITATVKSLISVLDIRSDLKESLLQSPSEGQSKCLLYSFISVFSFKPILSLRKIKTPILNTWIVYLHLLCVTWRFCEPFFYLTSDPYPSNLPENQLALSREEI